MRRFLFNAEDILDEFQLNLSKYIGPAAFYVNSLFLLERALELMLYGAVLGDVQYMSRFLADIKVPKEAKEELEFAFNSSLSKRITEVIPDFSTDYGYSYKVTELCDVIIDELGLLNMAKGTPEKDFIKELEENIANGDYVPEKFRQLVG